MNRIVSVFNKAYMNGLWVVAGSVLTYLLIFIVLIPGCANPREEREHFLNGREHVVRGRYIEAVPLLENYMNVYPQGEYASRAHLFLGKAYMGQLKLDEAARVFDECTQFFPQTLEGHKCLYKRAVIDLLKNEKIAALARFEKLADHPDGPLAPEARAFQNYLDR